MPRFVLRFYHALFPVVVVPVSILPTLSEAKALAVLLTRSGSCVQIQAVEQGFAAAKIGGVL